MPCLASVIRRYLLALACVMPVASQGQQFVVVTPVAANLVAGESQRFRLVDQNGRAQRGVSWKVSEGASVYREGDDLILTATKPGSFQILAQAAGGSSQADVKVIEGQALPYGSIKWSGPDFAGCKTTQIVPAVPDGSGVDILQGSRCPDGDYLSAYTGEGMLVSRYRIGQQGTLGQIIPTFGSNGTHKTGAQTITSPAVPIPPNRGRISLTSVCDAITVGTERGKVRELLESRSLSFSNDGSNEQIWIVEEHGARCKLWFDDKSAVARKSKTLVGD